MRIGEKDFHFNVFEIEADGSDYLIVTANEVGYWAQSLYQKVSFDIRSLLGVMPTLVEDAARITKIREQQTWC